MRKKILLVAGARPNFMKISALLRSFKKNKNFLPMLVHTGQHYDYQMSQSFFEDLEIKKPDYFLGIGSGTHAWQTARAMLGFEEVCFKEKPLLVIVVGDVNSTLACSVTATKINIKVAHIEAGLRSRDMSMPEEVNRIVTDSISSFLFATEKSGVDNLKREGHSRDKIFFVGNTMIDSLIFGLKKLDRLNVEKFSIKSLKRKLKDYAVLTLHRPANVDDKAKLKKLMVCLNSVSERIPLIFTVHPRTKKNIKLFDFRRSKNIYFLSPLRYLEFLFLYKDARFILTDSGGLQEETTYLKIPCLTLRENTERPITVSEGTNTVVGSDGSKIIKLADKILTNRYKRGRVPRLWDGNASGRIIDILSKKLK